MRYLFGSAGTRELTALLTSTPLFAFDFDGTLAPLSEQPARSALRATTRRLLARLAKSHRVVVISGRSRADLEPRFPASRWRASPAITAWSRGARPRPRAPRGRMARGRSRELAELPGS